MWLKGLSDLTKVDSCGTEETSTPLQVPLRSPASLRGMAVSYGCVLQLSPVLTQGFQKRDFLGVYPGDSWLCLLLGLIHRPGTRFLETPQEVAVEGKLPQL